MSKIITFATLKGGTGKTMNLFNLAGILAGKGKHILLIDLDPQCNLSANCGIDISDMTFTTVNDIFSKYKTGNILKAADIIILNEFNSRCIFLCGINHLFLRIIRMYVLLVMNGMFVTLMRSMC